MSRHRRLEVRSSNQKWLLILGLLPTTSWREWRGLAKLAERERFEPKVRSPSRFEVRRRDARESSQFLPSKTRPEWLETLRQFDATVPAALAGLLAMVIYAGEIKDQNADAFDDRDSPIFESRATAARTLVGGRS
jgi:hypothetical protein